MNGTPSNDTIGPAVVPFGSSQKIRCLAMSAAEEQTKQSLFRLKNKKVHYVRIQYLFLLEKHSESADLRQGSSLPPYVIVRNAAFLLRSPRIEDY